MVFIMKWHVWEMENHFEKFELIGWNYPHLTLSQFDLIFRIDFFHDGKSLSFLDSFAASDEIDVWDRPSSMEMDFGEV